MLGVLVSAVVLTIVAVTALASGQVRAEEESEETDTENVAVVCDGLGSLTMSVNTVTLKKAGTLTEYSYSTVGKCTMSLTLVDISSEHNPADKSKGCTVTATPVHSGRAIDLESIESGQCETVDFQIDLDLDDDYTGCAWASHSGEAEGLSRMEPPLGSGAPPATVQTAP